MVNGALVVIFRGGQQSRAALIVLATAVSFLQRNLLTQELTGMQ
jgi:hypothetical protein